MKQDRLEQLLEEIGGELENRREEDRLRLAEWFEGVLNAEYGRSRSTVQVNLVDALRRARDHGGAVEGEERTEQ